MKKKNFFLNETKNLIDKNKSNFPVSTFEYEVLRISSRPINQDNNKSLSLIFLIKSPVRLYQDTTATTINNIVLQQQHTADFEKERRLFVKN